MNRFLGILLAILVISPVLAQSTYDLDSPAPQDPDVRIGKLKNGLTYYIRKNPKPEDKAELRLVVNAGSILENDDQKGLAHFIEHMGFNGTKNFKKNELVNYLQSIGVEFGADLNAYTSFDETVYMLPIPTDDPKIVDKGLLVLRDWASGVTFDEEEIDKERGVVVEEWRRGRGASQRMRDQWFPVVFKDSKYAERLPIGTKEVIENASYATIRQFYKDWYRPDLMAVVVVGDIDEDVIEKKIQKIFGKIKTPKTPRDRVMSKVPAHEETYVAIAKDEEAAFTQVQVMYKRDQEEENTLRNLKDAMTRSLYSRMINQRLDELRRGENPPYVSAGSGFSEFVRTKSIYYSAATVGEGQLLQGLEAVLTENQRVLLHGFTDGELDRAKRSIIRGYERSLKEKGKKTSSSYVGKYISHFLKGNPIPSTDFSTGFAQAIIPSITLQEVNDLASKWITDENRVIVVTSPDKDGMELPGEAEILSILNDVKQKDIEPYNDELAADELVEELPEVGSVVSVQKHETVDATTWKLSNGMEVTWKKTDFQNDQILMSAYSYGGTSLYSDDDYHSASAASTAVNQGGLGLFSPIELKKFLAGKAVSVSPYIDSTQEGLKGSASPEDLELMFQLIHLHFTEPRKDNKAFTSYQERMKMVLPNLKSDPRYFYQDTVAKVMSQNHLRGGGLPTVEELEKVSFDRAYDIYKERFANAGDFHFYFVGNIPEDTFQTYVNQYLASLPSLDGKEDFKDVGIRPPSGQVKQTFYKGKDEKASVSISFTGQAQYTPDEQYQVNALGKVLQNRLIEVIREEKSGVYSVRASGSISRVPYTHYDFNIRFPCAPKNVDDLIAAVFDEINKLKNDGPRQEEVDKVKKAQKLNRKENLKKNRFWLGQLMEYDKQGEDLKDFYQYDDRVETLSVDVIQTMAKKYLTDSYIQLVLMPEAAAKD